MTAGLVSGYNLAKFAKDVVLKKGPAQIIVQDLSMASADVNGDLNVAGQITIGGVNFNNVVALNATETVRGKSSMLKIWQSCKNCMYLCKANFIATIRAATCLGKWSNH